MSDQAINTNKLLANTGEETKHEIISPTRTAVVRNDKGYSVQGCAGLVNVKVFGDTEPSVLGVSEETAGDFIRKHSDKHGKA